VLNLAFVFLQKIIFLVITLLLNIWGVSSVLDHLYNVLSRFSLPAFIITQSASETSKENESSMKINGEKTVDVAMWSKFFSLIALAIVLTDTIPTLFHLLDDHFASTSE
jgi:hypothetical protein